jgi:hypothetical protein
MKAVTPQFMEGIYAKTRQTKAVVTFSFVDPQAKDVVSYDTLPAQSATSKAEQMIDYNYTQVGRIAQFEPNYWTLDGSYLLPKPATETNSQYGLWTQFLSDDNGEYPSHPYIRFFFSEPVSIPGLTLTFDMPANQYLTDFDLIAYDENMTILRQESIRGNTNSRWSFAKGVQQLKYLDVVFLKTNKPNRRTRIIEVDFGILIIFEGKNLYTVNLISECDPLSETIPDNEMNLSAFNEDGHFDYTDEESYSKYLQERQELVYEHSLVMDEDGNMEAVPMGKYLLQTWKVKDTKVELKARLDLQMLEQDIFRIYNFNERMSAGEFIERIFNDAGWVNYEIASYLYDSPNILFYTGEVNHKEALRMVAALSGAVVLKMPTGKIIVTKIDFEDPTIVDTISYDNSLGPTDATSSKYYNALQLTVQAATAKEVAGGKPIVSYQDSFVGTRSLIIPFDTLLFQDGAISIAGATLVSYELYANYAYATVTASGAFTITVTGLTVEFNNTTEIVDAPWRQAGEPIYAYKFTVPMLVNNDATYTQVRDWMAAQKFRTLANRLATVSTWRQNPALDIGDYVSIQMDKRGAGLVPIFILKHSLAYSGGALRGVSDGVGAGVNAN